MFYQHLIFLFIRIISLQAVDTEELTYAGKGRTFYKEYRAVLWNQLKGRQPAKSHKGSRPRKRESHKEPREFSL